MPLPLALAAASFAGGLMNHFSQQSANNTNISLAQQNNDFNLQMWMMQNAYNAPAMQMSRYRQAGINPYLAVGNITPGIAQSAPQAQLVTVQPNNAIGNAVVDAANTFSSAMMQSAQMKSIELDNEAKEINNSFLTIKTLKELGKSDAEIRETMARASNQEILNKYEETKQKQGLEIGKTQIGLNNSSIAVNNAQQKVLETTEKKLKYELEELLPEQKKQIQANINNIYFGMRMQLADLELKKRLTNAQIFAIATNAAKTVAETAGIEFNNGVQKELRDYYIERYKTEVQMGYENLSGVQLDNKRKRKDLSFYYLDKGFDYAQRFSQVYSNMMSGNANFVKSITPLGFLMR